MTFAFTEPREWWLEVSPAVEAESWRQSQQHTTSASRWCAYTNQVCLHSVLSWIQREYAPEATAWLRTRDRSAVWDVVSGAAIQIGPMRLVLISSEALDDGELEVPQEWVDIPGWAADYYLAVQAKLDTSSEAHGVRVWGYTTHQALKAEGHYDPSDRTYCLDAQQLTRDLSTLWVTLQFCPEEQTQAAIAPLPALSPTHAENLIQRLGDPAVAFPRLAVPFSLWGALLEQPEWRQRLYQHRTQQGPTFAELRVHLSQWLQGQFSGGWQPIKTLLGESPGEFAVSLRSRQSSTGVEVTQIIELDSQPEPRSVVLLVALSPETDGRLGVLVQLHPARGHAHVPPHLVLSLQSDAGEVLQSVQADEQDDYIQLKRFRCPPGTCFSLQIMLDAYSVTQEFTA